MIRRGEGDGVITIELSWPDKRLSPNSRCHWSAKAKAVGEAKAQGFWETIDKIHLKIRGALDGEYQIVYTFHPPDRRKRDQDNCLAMMKASQDGMCSALNMDDSRIKRTVLEWGEVVKGGSVVLRLEEMK